MELLQKLGIDWRLLLWQIVNFVILFGVLTKLLYRPILKMLDERSRKIAQGLQDAEAARLSKEKGEQERAHVVNEARKEAQKILEVARVQGEKLRNEIVDTAKHETDRVLVQAKSNIQSAKEEMLKQVRGEAATLVAGALEKIIGKTLTLEVDKKLVEQALKEATK